MRNSYIARFEFVSAPTLYATIYAETFEAASDKRRELADQHGSVSHSLTVLADDKDVNPRALQLIADLTVDQYLGQFEAETRPARLEVVVEAPPGCAFTAADAPFIRRQLAGYDVVSIREI